MNEPVGLTFARQIVRYGWKIAPGFVTAQGVKLPLAGNWVKNATKDEEKLEAWWAAKPWMWPGCVSGPGSSLVFDLDGEEAVTWFRELANRIGWESGGLTYLTPGRSGGCHSVWSWPTFLDPNFGQAKLHLPGGAEAQLRGGATWTLLCGARRPDCRGREYIMLEEPTQEPAPEAPQRLVEAFLELAESSPVGRGTGELKEISPEDAWNLGRVVDGRKNFVACLAWYCALRGSSEGEVYNVCRRFNEEICCPPLPDGLIVIKSRYAVERAAKAREVKEEEIRRIQALYRRFS